MIWMDKPRKTTFRNFARTSHLMSDLPGERGTAELLACGKAIGMRPEWLQHRGEPREHFDIFDGKVAAAVALGIPQVTGRELIRRCVLPKRAARAVRVASEAAGHSPNSATAPV